MINTLRSANIDPHLARVLDVGCGDGGSLWLLVRLGFPANNLVGVDIQQDRILKARARQTEITFECGDATKLRFADCSFHLVMESTMFIHATDDVVATAIADEMIRVTKPGGTLLISDWRYAKPHNPHYKAVTAKRIKELFKVGVRTELLKRSPGALLPPVGRFLSKRCSWSYFAVQKIFPFITGHMVTLIRKV
jgi:ubiquinone/menaquinone biosynthesis C-methylase UbiE